MIKSYMLTLLIGLVLGLGACSKKEAIIIDRHERYPLDQVPPALLARASQFALKNNVAVDFLKGEGDTYMLRFVILRRSQEMPSTEQLAKIKMDEIIPLSIASYNEVFLKQPLKQNKCSLVIFVIYYYDNAATFFFY